MRANEPAALRLSMPCLRPVEAGAAGPGPAIQDQRPLPVVGEVVALAQVAQLGDACPEARHVAAHLLRHRAVRQRDRQAVRVLQRTGPGRRRPASWTGPRRPGRAASGRARRTPRRGRRPGCRCVRAGRRAGQLGSVLEVFHRLGGLAQRHGRPADAEVSRAARLGAGVDQRQRSRGPADSSRAPAPARTASSRARTGRSSIESLRPSVSARAIERSSAAPAAARSSRSWR